MGRRREYADELREFVIPGHEHGETSWNLKSARHKVA
jgi:hypothetical protein